MALIQLAVSRDEARRRILRQTKEAEEIVGREILDGASAEKFLEDQEAWRRFTTELLRRVFTTIEFSEEFYAAWLSAGMSGLGETLKEKVEITTAGMNAQLRTLRAIDKKLDLLNEPSVAGPSTEGSVAQKPKQNAVKIFISHGSEDAPVAEKLADLLRNALSMPPKEIRCTSVLAYSLPFGIDPSERLRAEVSSAQAMVGLVTQSSLESYWVLFEMGARWGQGKPLFCVLARDADYTLLPDPIRHNHALKVADSAGVVKFVDDLADVLGLGHPSSWQYQKFVDDFIAAAILPTAAIVSAEQTVDGPASLDGFKRKYRFENNVYWKYDDKGNRSGPFCPHCVDDGEERQLIPGLTKGYYTCSVHEGIRMD